MIVGNNFGGVADTPGVQMQRSGKILRGAEAPHVLAGYPGNVYIETTNRYLYMKRLGSGTNQDTWGAWVYQFTTPTYDAQFLAAKWYGDTRPTPSIGIDGDFYLQWNCDNPSLCPKAFGPKKDGAWPEEGEDTEICGQDLTIAGQVGALDEGGDITITWTLPAFFVGALDEVEWYTLGDQFCVTPIGVLSFGQDLCMSLNPLWNVEAADNLALGVTSEGS